MVDGTFTREYMKTTNPNNGSQGFSRNASFAKARRRKAQRQAAWAKTVRALGLEPVLPVVVTVCRVAPSGGLDPHDALGPALKGIIDGIADGLGLKNDRDPRVTWVLAQRRGEAGLYAVEVRVRFREAGEQTGARPGATSGQG